MNTDTPMFGTCICCNGPRSSSMWCKTCDIAYLKNNFVNWTSGNRDIDDFIRYTQLNATQEMDYLEWIEFESLEFVENIHQQGAFSSIYSALWLEGPMSDFDEDAEVVARSGPVKVILKRLDNSSTLSKEYINQLYRYHRCLLSTSAAECYGMTKDPTSCYMFVMKYYDHGNLYSFLDENLRVICWQQIIDFLWEISYGIKSIHDFGLTYGHLHGGNILVETESDSINAKIADIGLHGPVISQQNKEIYGVVPFVAPEIFTGNTPTRESDIYSFGMIMWTLSSGERPYYDTPHDSILINNICSGLRPSVVSGTPPAFASLMLKCLDANPLNRPTASDLYECFGSWVTTICDDPNVNSSISEQFDKAEEIKLAKLESLENFNFPPNHERSIYTSRPLSIINPF